MHECPDCSKKCVQWWRAFVDIAILKGFHCANCGAMIHRKTRAIDMIIAVPVAAVWFALPRESASPELIWASLTAAAVAGTLIYLPFVVYARGGRETGIR